MNSRLDQYARSPSILLDFVIDIDNEQHLLKSVTAVNGQQKKTIVQRPTRKPLRFLCYRSIKHYPLHKSVTERNGPHKKVTVQAIFNRTRQKVSGQISSVQLVESVLILNRHTKLTILVHIPQ